MPAIEELLPVEQAAALEQLRAWLCQAEAARVRAQAEPTAAVCPTCGQPRPVPAAVFRAPVP